MNPETPRPIDDLPPEVVAVARTANCTRCNAVVVDEPSIAGTIMFNYYLPALSQQHRGYLCGACGLLFREFLYPALKENEAFQALAARLRGAW